MSLPELESLTRVVEELRSELAQARKEIARLRAENASLRARLEMNSSNSSRPPSSDGPGAEPRQRSLRRASGRRPGGQVGHTGTTLRQVSDPHEVLVHAPSVCERCGAGLGADADAEVVVRQVFDIPTPSVRVTEYRLVTRTCACGHRTSPPTPPGVQAPVQYGPGIAAVGLYLHQGQYLSAARAAQALGELFDTPVSVATILGWTARAAGDLAGFTTAVAHALAGAPLLHVDETSIKGPGARTWIHSASNSRYTLLGADPSRGTRAMDAMGVLPAFTGTLVHDAYAPYDTYPQITSHILCGAHLLRELQAVTDHHRAGSEAGTWCWATQVTDAFHRLLHVARDGPLDANLLAAQTHQIRSAATIATSEPTPGPLDNKHRALARRILQRLPDYLAFTRDPALPFTNNAAEREVRMVKVRAKISGILRTHTGARHFATIRSYLATTRKHAIPMLQALTALTSRNPWMPATT